MSNIYDPCTKLIGGGGRWGVHKSFSRNIPNVLLGNFVGPRECLGLGNFLEIDLS